MGLLDLSEAMRREIVEAERKVVIANETVSLYKTMHAIVSAENDILKKKLNTLREHALIEKEARVNMYDTINMQRAEIAIQAEELRRLKNIINNNPWLI